MKYLLIIISSIFYLSALPLTAEESLPIDLCKEYKKNKFFNVDCRNAPQKENNYPLQLWCESEGRGTKFVYGEGFSNKDKDFYNDQTDSLSIKFGLKSCIISMEEFDGEPVEERIEDFGWTTKEDNRFLCKSLSYRFNPDHQYEDFSKGKINKPADEFSQWILTVNRYTGELKSKFTINSMHKGDFGTMYGIEVLDLLTTYKCYKSRKF